MRKLTQEDFVAKARQQHGDLYSYEKSKFTGIGNKVIITCCRCGRDFKQNARAHYTGQGCAVCNASGGGSKKHTTEQFVQKARKVHGRRYNYSHTIYRSAHGKVSIVCRKHGAFKQTATSHLSGVGCPQCGASIVKKTAETKRVPTAEWLRRFYLAHGDAYSYPKRLLIQSQYDKINIECSKHGSFGQTVLSHALGHGCPKCKHNMRFCNTTQTWLRGYEPQAAAYIVKAGLAKSHDLDTSPPHIEYRFARSTRRYVPDFFIKSQNRLVEVKSVGTMGLKSSFIAPTEVSYRLLQKLKAKRCGCIRAGYKFSLLVMNPDGSRVALPKRWYQMTVSDLRSAVGL